MTSPAPRRGEAATGLDGHWHWTANGRCAAYKCAAGNDRCPLPDRLAVLALPEVAELRSAARCWGYADVAPDGHVNPGAVHYASNEEAAVRLAEAWDGTPVTRLVTEWAALASSSATEPESAS